MKIHHYDPQDGLYRGESQADPDPVELDRARRMLLARRTAKANGDFAKALANGVDLVAAETACAEAMQLASAEVAALTPQHWLIPANATQIAPPPLEPGEQAVFVDGEWTVEAVPEVEPPLDDTEVDTPPADLASLARRRRDGEIDSLRWLVERHGDQIALDEATTLSAERFVQVLRHIQALRDVPAQAGFPDTIDWPVLSSEPQTQTPPSEGEDPQ